MTDDDWTISASKIKAYERCPEEFRLRYIEGHEETGPPSRWIRRGNAVHETLEEALTGTESASISSDVLKGIYQSNGGRAAYTLSEDDHAAVMSSLEAAARYLRDHVDEVLDVELEVEYGVDRHGIWKDFGGFMDLATDTGVVDWKTGKSEGKAGQEAIQGAVYMAGYADEYGRPPDHVTFAYLNPEAGDDHPKTRSINPDDDLWETLLGKARTLLDAVERDEFIAQPDEEKCHWCDFEVFCSASPVGAGNVDYGSYP